MPIQMVEADNRFEIVGKIRLGVRKEKGDTEYPANVDYFVTKDAPDVARYYGDNPKEIDVFFLSDDRETSIPTWLMLYGKGAKDPKTGEVVGGALKCYGNGPDPDGRPGIAYNIQERGVDGSVPTRECRGKNCPDWAAGCGPKMKVFVFMPHCNPTGLFQIDTGSEVAINAFHRQLRTLEKTVGRIAGIPLKLAREVMTGSRMDTKTGKKVPTTNYTVSVRYNPEFVDKYSDIKVQLDNIRRANILLPTQQELLERPMEDNYPVLEAAPARPALEGASHVPDKDAFVNQVLMDPEVVKLFHELGQLKGGQYQDKARRQAVLKKIQEPDVRAAVVASLQEAIAAEKAKQKAPPPAAAVSDGIL